MDVMSLDYTYAKKYDGEEDFINKKLDEIYSYKKLSAAEVIHFLAIFFTVYVFSLVF